MAKPITSIDAWELGYTQARDNFGRYENPYDDGEDRDAWRAGFDAALTKDPAP